MTGFKYAELTFTSDQMDDDSQRINVLWLNLVATETFETCDLLVFWFKGEVVRFMWNKPVLVPPIPLSRKIGCERNRLLSY